MFIVLVLNLSATRATFAMWYSPNTPSPSGVVQHSVLDITPPRTCLDPMGRCLNVL